MQTVTINDNHVLLYVCVLMEKKIVFKEKVESGSTFADALKNFPKTFDTLYQNMIAAGEVGGILDTILNRLAVYLEKNEKLKRQIKGAMMYPIITMVVAFVVVTILLVFVVPQFAAMFADMVRVAEVRSHVNGGGLRTERQG